jgi:lipoprotein-releasing system ATP-binding protein
MRKDNIGFVFQFSLSACRFNVIENILIPVWKDKNKIITRAEELLGIMGLTSRQKHMPHELSEESSSEWP